MRGLLIGVVAAAGLAAATPASAQGFYFGAPGVSIGVGGGGGYYGEDRGYDHGGYGPRAYSYDGPRRMYRQAEYCRTFLVQRRDGSMRRVTRCR
jgi:hypothetical protein